VQLADTVVIRVFIHQVVKAVNQLPDGVAAAMRSYGFA